ncbi:WXG100 family type VII secretion target [Actinomadura sp. 6N118]|uniref:WXG100 family type VII secretion target n=1 Tax=Actinomadura sp. 6N118 TaxID=3375151 RepID=UPI00379F103D
MPVEGRMRMARIAMDDIMAKLDKGGKDIAETLTTMDKQVKALLGGENWSGNERVEYDAQQEIWNRCAVEMQSAGMTGASTLRNMVNNVDMTEDYNKRSWQNVYG